MSLMALTRTSRSVLSLIAASLIGSMSPAFAYAIPEALLQKTFRLVLETTPEGPQLVSRLLGREIPSVTVREYGETIQILSDPRNQSLAEELASRVHATETQLGAEVESAVLREVTSRQFGIETSDAAQILFVDGESRSFVGSLTASREKFLAMPQSQSLGQTWSSLELRSQMRPTLEQVYQTRGMLAGSRMVMRLDGSTESLERLADVMQSYVRVAKKVSESVAIARNNGGLLTSDERKVLERELDEITELTVDLEATSYLKDQRPASFKSQVKAYNQASAELNRARAALKQLK